MNFDDIEYLKEGTTRQRSAYKSLTLNKTFLKLEKFDPLLVGTIPINIDINKSDLDIICCFTKIEEFKESLTNNFKNEKNFSIR